MNLIDKIKLSDFIDYIVDDSYPDKDEWSEILLQYSCALKSDSFEQYLRSMIFINSAYTKFNLVEKLVQVLEQMYVEEYVQELKAFGYMGEFDWNKKDRYIKELKACYSKAKVFLGQAKQKEAELRKQLADFSTPDKEQIRSNFIHNILSLSKFQGYAVKEDDITVLKYCLLLNKMIEHGKSDQGRSR